MTSAEAWAEFEGQGTLQPGEPGWWQVWGASVRHIRPGDLVMTAGEPAGFLVTELFTARSVMRLGIVVDGERQTIGMGCPIALLRQGTKNTLAD